MALTRDFKQTILERVQREPAFAKALFDEACILFFNGEPDLARAVLRDLVNATVGFEAMANNLSMPSKSLHRMLSKQGNPSMRNIAAIFSSLRKILNVQLEIKVTDAHMLEQPVDSSEIEEAILSSTEKIFSPDNALTHAFSLDDFVERMNAMFQNSIGAKESNFTNSQPSGSHPVQTAASGLNVGSNNNVVAFRKSHTKSLARTK